MITFVDANAESEYLTSSRSWSAADVRRLLPRVQGRVGIAPGVGGAVRACDTRAPEETVVVAHGDTHARFSLEAVARSLNTGIPLVL